MDFLALPIGLQNGALVPDLGGPDYDNSGFANYPERQGWQIERLLSGDIVGARDEWNEYSQMVMRDIPPDQMPETGEDLIKAVTGPFIQTWLFFGLFHEVLSRPVLRSECSFTHRDHENSSKRYLSAQRLFTEFVQRKEQIKDDLVWCARVSSCLRQASWALTNLDMISETLGGFVIPGFAQLALCVLVRTLDDHSVIFCQPHIRPANASLVRCRWLEQRLLDNGWCPNLVKRFRTDLGIEGLYYASLINFVDLDRSHGGCTDSACIAYNHAKDETYIFQHSVRYCLCKDEHCKHLADSCICSEPINMGTAASEAAAIVRQGQMPLLSLVEEGSHQKIQVTPFCHGIKYVAISHVWSDGMGNPHKNSLPLCQVQALDYFVRKAGASSIDSDQAYFWIDTICVPRAPDSLRRSAIATMRDTYRDADCVLVICRELSTIRLPSTPDEILVRIFSSKWMTRLWTLQEGALAARLVFQFADHAIDYRYLDDFMIAAVLDVTNTSRLVGNRANLNLASITSIISSASLEDAQGEERQKTYSSLWNALRHRATSRRSDEAVCAAILLDVNLGPILDSPHEKKMEAFWTNQDRVPTGVLWVNGPRMDIDSLRWAPKSLLDARTWALSFPDRGLWASRTSAGLIFEGIEGFSLVDAPLPTIENGVLEFHDVRSRVSYYISQMQNVGNAQWTELAENWVHCALLWRETPPPDFFAAGALVSCNKTEARITHARWLAQVCVSVKGGEWDQIVLNGPSEFSEGKVTSEAVPVYSVPSVEYLGPDREWCIW
ncbi:hypothetical protein N7G274_007235 [Stereocaulon virgatum]|uniref:Heterokaryon incompatibility domain-containing protein n=1 Tax=Stereocaulon virgatum TaxID=373712 RepID=A0ABR4A2V0_9LECA